MDKSDNTTNDPIIILKKTKTCEYRKLKTLETEHIIDDHKIP